MNTGAILYTIFDKLLTTYGPQSWWPADTPFEVMLGAVLTQNTSWSNVEKAMTGLRAICDMTPGGILSLPESQVLEAVRQSGYFNQKAKRLRILCNFIEEYGGDIEPMRSVPTRKLRQQFLGLQGVGPETADSILLYALERPIFVVDAYTVRLCSRIGLTNGNEKYDRIQSLFMENIERDVHMFNEYHALIVRHGKTRCRKTSPYCAGCPLLDVCVFP